MDESTKIYLAIDPGKVNTGFAWFDDTGNPVENASIKGVNEFLDWLDEQPVAKMIIIEDYKNRPWATANQWSSNDTSKLIGAIERYAHKNKIPIKMSQPANLQIGLRFLGMGGVYKKGTHVPDQVSALAHGVYMLQKLGIRKHRLEKK